MLDFTLNSFAVKGLWRRLDKLVRYRSNASRSFLARLIGGHTVVNLNAWPPCGRAEVTGVVDESRSVPARPSPPERLAAGAHPERSHTTPCCSRAGLGTVQAGADRARRKRNFDQRPAGTAGFLRNR